MDKEIELSRDFCAPGRLPEVTTAPDINAEGYTWTFPAGGSLTLPAGAVMKGVVLKGAQPMRDVANFGAVSVSYCTIGPVEEAPWLDLTPPEAGA